MGFNIEQIRSSFGRDLISIYILDELQNAEKNGLTHVIIEKPDLMEYKDLIGQIFHYQEHRRNEDEEPKLKNVWKLVRGKDHTIRKKRDGGHVQDEAGELVFEVIEGNYLPDKTQFLTQREVTETVEKEGKGLWKVGRYLINKNGDYAQIKAIKIEEAEDKFLTREQPKTNPHKHIIFRDVVGIVIGFEDSKRIDVNNPEFDGEKTYTNEDGSFEKFEDEWFVIEDTDLIGYERKVIQAKELGSLEVFGEQLKIGTSKEELMQQDMGEGSTALMGMKSQDQLQLMHDNIYKKNNLSKAVQGGFTRVIRIKREELEAALAVEKQKMELMKQELEYQVSVFTKQMKKIQRLITTLEIYMGESENVVQIAEGENAPDGEVIHLRQMMLYMDEEFGDPDNGGLDFKTIEKFDEWIVDSGNFEQLVPEQKCVVVMRPRRYDKDYEDLRGGGLWDAMEREIRRELNSKFYVLIRNGQNLYKIFTDRIEFGKRLFPLKAELQEFMDKMAASQVEMNKHDVRDYSYRSAEEDFEKANDKLFFYQRNFLLLQGIIMRTTIFNPIPADFNFLDVSTHEGVVEFIYDEETALSDGRLRFEEYRNKINESIQKGSRIIVGGDYYKDDYSHRFNIYISDRMLHSIQTPSKGIYTVKSRKIKTLDYETIWMRESKWKTIKKEQELNEAKYKVTTHHSTTISSTSINYPEGKHPKYSEGSRYRENEIGEEERELYLLDENGNKIKKEKVNEELYISYSYQHRYTNKTQNKTFIIKPTDKQIINYDALVLDDLDYYLSNRMDRPNYVHMMPLLYKLRDELRDEHKSEEGFALLTKNELLREYPSLGELDIESMIWDAIEWWKNKKATVWKRPISKDDGKALEMILQEVKKKCKKAGKKNINTGTNYKEVLLVWTIRRHTFYGFGVTKKEFAAQVNELKIKDRRILNIEGFSKCINEVRGIRIPRGYREEKMMLDAKENKGIVKLYRY